VRFKEIKIGRKKGIGIEISLPKAPLVLAVGKKGFLMCGYLNVTSAVRLGDSAAVVKGVRSIEELLEKSVVAVTPQASRRGVRVGMPGHKALSRLF